MADEMGPAIAALERRLTEAERKVNELKSAINVLCAEAGMQPRYPDGGGGGGTQAVTSIQSDTFYGQPQQKAVRTYLEMRKAQGQGPATPREIFDALKAGGFDFRAKNDEIAMVGLRALLRKRTEVFHKLPNTGSYGLMAWYPNARAAKGTGPSDEGPDYEELFGDEKPADDKAKAKSSAA